jgi:hypothetical protein
MAEIKRRSFLKVVGAVLALPFLAMLGRRQSAARIDSWAIPTEMPGSEYGYSHSAFARRAEIEKMLNQPGPVVTPEVAQAWGKVWGDTVIEAFFRDIDGYPHRKMP